MKMQMATLLPVSRQMKSVRFLRNAEELIKHSRQNFQSEWTRASTSKTKCHHENWQINLSTYTFAHMNRSTEFCISHPSKKSMSTIGMIRKTQAQTSSSDCSLLWLLAPVFIKEREKKKYATVLENGCSLLKPGHQACLRRNCSTFPYSKSTAFSFLLGRLPVWA